MSDGLTAVLGRISEIRSALGVSSGGILGARPSSSEDFQQLLRDASSASKAGSGRSRSSSSATSGSDPLERAAIPGKGSVNGAGKGSKAAELSSWPSGVPEEAKEYADAFAAASAETGVPLRILLAVAWAESAFRPGAESSVGAQGMMQLMPGTAAGLGVDPSDPVQNIMGGARYLAAQYEAFGSWDLAFAAYNAGPGAVQKYGGIPPYSETRHYIENINSYLDRMGEGVPTPASTLVNQSAVLPVAGASVPAAVLPVAGASVPSAVLPAAGAFGPDLAPAAVQLTRASLMESVLASAEGRSPGASSASVPDLVASALGALDPAGSAGGPGMPALPGGALSGLTLGRDGAGDGGSFAAVAAATGAAARADAPPATTPAAATNLGSTTLAALPEQVVAHIQRTRADGQTAHRLVVRLDPPELGAVSVAFEVRGSEVHLIVRPERPESSQLLAESRDRLATLLSREGLQLSGFDVATAGQERQQPQAWAGTTRGAAPVDLDLDSTDVTLTVDRGLRL